MRDLFAGGSDLGRFESIVRGAEVLIVTVLVAVGSAAALVVAIVLAVGAVVPGLAPRARRALARLRASLFG